VDRVTEKKSKLFDLIERWQGCKKCSLHETRTNIVFPSGNPDADVVVIGIGPGEDEDLNGLPFIGASGDILSDYLKEINFDRDELAIMNIVGCRPTATGKDKFGRDRVENRDPTLPERAACRPMWEEALYIIDPLLIIAMGKPAVQEVTRKRSVTMGEVQGRIDRCTITGRVIDITYPVLCTYHPAYLARSGNVYKGGPWHQTLIAWQRAIYFLDRLRHIYRGEEIPKRPWKEKEMSLIRGELPT
jgi:uracil-DNA glycosylase family 4